MPIVSAAIPNMINGISQQPFALRLASQAEAQVNGFSSISEGLIKRPNTIHKAKLIDGDLDEAFIHIINRDEVEKYVVVIANGDLKVFDFEGQEKVVNFPNGKGYLQSRRPAREFSAVTVADYTFLVNKTVVTEEDTLTSPTRPPEALIWVRQGNYSTKYEIIVDGVSKEYTTPSGTTSATDPVKQKEDVDAAAAAIRTDAIAGQLRTQLLTIPGLVVEQHGSVLRVTKSNNGDFTITGRDSMGDQAMSVIKGEVQTFTSLPRRAFHGFQVELTGSPSNAFDRYYVEYREENGNEGVWKEIPEPGRRVRIKRSTMPHTLIREADGSFTFKAAAWDDAQCGDDETNPFPSFIGNRISDVFFFRNRLGVIADENVVFSRASDFFNFFRSTVTAVLDTDPVDVQVSHVQVSILRHAIPFNESLLLFSDQTQFILTAQDVLTPATASISQTTEFETSLEAKPVGAGRYVYFAFNRGSFGGIREYYIDGQSDTKDANDVTSHCPRYIPKGIFRMAASTNEDVMLVLSRGQRNKVWVYKWFFSGAEKVQSSWSEWEFAPTDRILNVEMIESEAWFVIQRPDGVYLEQMSLEVGRREDQAVDFAYLLDRLVRQDQCQAVYDPQTKKTTITLPYEETGALRMVAGQGGPQPVGYVVPIEQPHPNVVVASGDWTGVAQYRIGRLYRFFYRFSPLLLREEAPGGGQVATTEGRLQITFMNLNFAESGFFRVEVTPHRRPPHGRAMTGRVLGSANGILGELGLETGAFRFPVIANNLAVTIDIINDTHLPCRFLNAEWEGKYTVRSKRMD
ncbi:hypothetical protein [Telmatospirillum sp. J64-1]|uniref:phage nozzle protein n=1 Tax=Telmatospirillum sp. J64-1 TaxID=2502183 RepID=UPI00115EC0DE|nr:hypothetical protein [Telmatospirillum sp. J64-1]